ncbi:MAG TPA: glycosyltransferase family 4 protein [Candidatus Paceibacterota bacterium]|nr:glycosyltransferase family 4 protein [Candidatus Paceibacterota bacterium]
MADAKKIAIVSDTVYPYFKGGKEKRIHEITTRLAAQGHDVTIYTMKWWSGGNTIKENGVTLRAISPLYAVYYGKRRSTKEAIFFALYCLRLLWADFDVMEADHMPHPVLFPLKIVCMLKRKKMIVTWHEVWGREYWDEYLSHGLQSWIAWNIEKMSAHLPDLVVSVSRHTTREVRGILKRKRPVVTVENGLDMATILKNPPAPRGANILFAGRLLSHKNVDVLVRATARVLKKYPDVVLWIIGEGPARASLESLAKELGIEKNVAFLGFLKDEDELYRVMQASQIFALPSTREGFGIAAIEANACGMPVITIDHEHNAARDLIINGENGTLIKLDEAQMAAAIESYLFSKKDRAQYRTYAEKYDWNRAVSELQKIYAS